MTQRPAARAVLVDFGGVLTSSVHEALAAVGRDVAGDPGLVLRLLSRDSTVKQALVDHEEGRLDDEGFEEALSTALGEAGVAVGPVGLIARLQATLTRDEAMVSLVGRLRALGFPVGLISNSLGRDCYAGYDLDVHFDAQAISRDEGVRKPSRRLYEIACERLGVAPTEVILIDDLRQNVDAATRLGMRGIVHTDAGSTRAALADLLDLDPAALDTTAPEPSASGSGTVDDRHQVLRRPPLGHPRRGSKDPPGTLI